MSTIAFHYSHENMALTAKRALIGLSIFIGACMVAHCGTGCQPAQDPTALEQGYTAEIVACAATAGLPGPYDHDADMKCRAKVDCKYKLGACADAGH